MSSVRYFFLWQPITVVFAVAVPKKRLLQNQAYRISIEEADETIFWLEILRDSNIYTGNEIGWLIDESDQILAILNKTRYTAKKNYRPEKPKRFNSLVKTTYTLNYKPDQTTLYYRNKIN